VLSPALCQTCLALHGPFFPVRHNHGSRRSALPSRRDFLRARQAVAPSPTLASEILTRKTNDAIVHHLRALEIDLAEAGEEVGRSAERVKRAVTAAEQPADREYLGEMLVSDISVCSLAGGSRADHFVRPPFLQHDAVYSILGVVSANTQIRAWPPQLDDVARPAPVGVSVPSDAPRPSPSARSRSKRMAALQKVSICTSVRTPLGASRTDSQIRIL
jgi:hypothetical protein